MRLEEIECKIQELKKIVSILTKPIENDAHLIYRAYIETEKLSETKRIIDDHEIKQDNGNRFQINDISKFIASNRPEVDDETKSLAQKILKKNSIKR